MSRTLVRGVKAGTVRDVAGASTAAAVHTVDCQLRLVGTANCRLAGNRLGIPRGMSAVPVGRISSVRVQCIARCRFIVNALQ